MTEQLVMKVVDVASPYGLAIRHTKEGSQQAVYYLLLKDDTLVLLQRWSDVLEVFVTTTHGEEIEVVPLGNVVKGVSTRTPYLQVRGGSSPIDNIGICAVIACNRKAADKSEARELIRFGTGAAEKSRTAIRPDLRVHSGRRK